MLFSLELAPIEQSLPLLSSLIHAGILPELATLTLMDLGHQTFPLIASPQSVIILLTSSFATGIA